MKRKHLLAMMVAGAIALVGCGGGGDDSGGGEKSDSTENGGGGGAAASVDTGKTLFAGTCATCHGPDAKGLPNLGKDLTTSTFVAEQTDEEFVAFIKKGRPASDPANTTGVDMPAKGGNPSLTDTDLQSIVLYVRSIHVG